MRKAIQILTIQTSLFGKDELTLFPEDFLASHTVVPDKEKAKKISVTNGPKCLEQLGKFSRVGLWAKTFAALLIGGGGLVFDEIQADLEAEGYEVLPFLLPACSVNNIQRRDRIWFIAHNVSMGRRQNTETGLGIQKRILQERQRKEGTIGYKARADKTWIETATTLCGVDDGISSRLDGITVSNWKNKSIESFGNTIVPQVAYEIFQAIDNFGI